MTRDLKDIFLNKDGLLSGRLVALAAALGGGLIGVWLIGLLSGSPERLADAVVSLLGIFALMLLTAFNPRVKIRKPKKT